MNALIERAARVCRVAGCEHPEDEIAGFLEDIRDAADRDPRVATAIKAVLADAAVARRERIADERRGR